MPQFVRRAQPPLNFIPTDYNPLIMKLVKWTLPFLLRFRIRPWLPAGIQRIEVDNVERLVELYEQFEAGKARFIIAPRHVEVDDPLSGLYLCSTAVAKAAAAKGIKLKQPVHTHFLYERGMTIWAGKGLGWLLSRIGGSPVRRGRKPDWVGLKAARKIMTDAEMPMVVAPEGATNGYSERLGQLEPGVAQLSFWCAEDLHRNQRQESVFIAPIGLQYRYVKSSWPKLTALLSKLEAQSGLPPLPADSNPIEKHCYLRILRLGEHLIKTMESFYTRFHHKTFEAPELEETDSSYEYCAERLQQLLDKSLQVAEQFFNLPNKGTLVDRCRRLEETSWNCIYREDLPELNTISPLKRGLADWAAQEASVRALHMRIVESFVAVDGQYLAEKPSFERCAETTLLMSDMLARLDGDKLPGRPRLGLRWVKMTVQPPIEVTSRLANYQQNRRAGRAAVNALTEEIRASLEATIER